VFHRTAAIDIAIGLPARPRWGGNPHDQVGLSRLRTLLPLVSGGLSRLRTLLPLVSGDSHVTSAQAQKVPQCR
jgi:hypothetical protein